MELKTPVDRTPSTLSHAEDEKSLSLRLSNLEVLLVKSSRISLA